MELSYFNARVRGLRGRFLDKARYNTLLDSRTGPEYLDALRGTAYGPYIERAEGRFERFEEIINAALRLNLLDTGATLRRTAPPEAAPLLKGVFSQWEAYNLKAIIRGIARGAKREEIRAGLLPLGEFDMAALNLLLGSRGIEDLIRFLETWGSAYGPPLRAGYGEFKKLGHVLPLELGLDLFIYQWVLSGLARRGFDCWFIRETTAMRIDAENIMTLFKIAGEPLSREGAQGFFIEGGRRVPRALFLECAGKTRDEAGAILSGKLKDRLFLKALREADYEELNTLEELLYDAVQRRLERAAIVRPLSIALASAFLYTKVREIKNLRILARAKLFGVPKDELKRFLFY